MPKRVHTDLAPSRLSLIARAILAAGLVASAPTWAAVTTSGDFGVGPVGFPIGPGDTVLPTSGLWMGNPGNGSLTTDGGSFLQLARLSFGSGGTAIGTGLFTGAGTRVELVGDGASDSQVNRLIVGDWGVGHLTVSAGALLDARGNQAPCLLVFHYCDSFVGGAAGDTAVLAVTGAGTRAQFGQNLFVAQPGLAIQHLDGWTYGVPGGTTRGTVHVTEGAVLSTDRAQIAPRHRSTNATGQERSIAEVLVSGPGSTWEVVGGSVVDNVSGIVYEGGASVLTANDRNAWATLAIRDGGTMHIVGQPGVYNGIILTNGGGRTDAVVSGAGSSIQFSGDAGYLHVGRSLGSATLDVLAGGVVQGAFYSSVGRNGSFGTLSVDGDGSLFQLDGTASAAANGTFSSASMDIGRNGTGVVNVRNGGRLEVLAAQSTPGGLAMSLGRDLASSGTLNISGANSVVLVQSTSVVPGGGAGESWNPIVRFGRDGSGTLSISAGGVLHVDGRAESTPTDSRSTNVYVGGTSSTAPGGRGVATVSGPGSALRVTGSDAYLAVGIGPTSTGQLTVSDQAEIRATIMNVGRAGVGVLAVDNARVDLIGQYSGGGQYGAAISIGTLGGIGNASFSNGAVMRIENAGTSGVSLNLDGTEVNPLGDGSLTLSGGSRVELIAAPGQATASIGRDGSGMLRMKEGSVLDMGDGNLYVGRLNGSDGTVVATGGSSIEAGWVGIGRHKTEAGSVDGGTGTMVLNGATLTADEIVIGTNGYLGGSAGSIVANQITNHGIFSPGSSPGTFNIDAAFVAALGSRLILEVAFEGGQFVTDRVNFMQGRSLDLGAMNVEFRFLGDASPDAFQAGGGFVIDTFLAQQDGQGGSTGLAPELFQQVQFSARADAYRFESFSFSADSGAEFVATPVPEPSVWMLLLSGAALMRWRARSVLQA